MSISFETLSVQEKIKAAFPSRMPLGDDLGIPGDDLLDLFSELCCFDGSSYLYVLPTIMLAIHAGRNSPRFLDILLNAMGGAAPYSAENDELLAHQLGNLPYTREYSKRIADDQVERSEERAALLNLYQAKAVFSWLKSVHALAESNSAHEQWERAILFWQKRISILGKTDQSSSQGAENAPC